MFWSVGQLSQAERNKRKSVSWKPSVEQKNSSLNAENAELKEQNRDYKLLRKVFGSKQIDGLLEQAKQSKQRDKRFRDNQNER